MRELDRVQLDVHLVFQDRIDVDRGIGKEQRARVGGSVWTKTWLTGRELAKPGAGRHDPACRERLTRYHAVL